MTSSPDLLIRHVRPLGAEPADVLVLGGRIAALGPGLAAPAGCAVEDGGGALLLPGLVESHTHLDKTMWGLDWYRNEVGPRLIDRIDNERALRAAMINSTAHPGRRDDKARNYVLAHHSSQAMAGKYLGLYQALRAEGHDRKIA